MRTTATPAALSFVNWSSMSASRGETTIVGPSSTSAGSWYVSDLPLPVGMTASVSRPASTDSMISAWPERSSRRWKTSRIFSRARSSAGEGGGGGASGVMTGAAAEMDGAAGASSPSGPEPSRRMMIVGTPSAPVTRNRRPRAEEEDPGESAEGCSDEGGEWLSGSSAATIVAPARESSSELRLNSYQRTDGAPALCAPTRQTLVHPVTTNRVFVWGSAGKTSTQPQP